MAMQDAFELTDCLTGSTFPDVQTAPAHFEKQMLKRTERLYNKMTELSSPFFKVYRIIRWNRFYLTYL